MLALFERSLHITDMMSNFSVSFYCPIGELMYAKNWDGGGGQVTCMWTSTSFLYEYNYDLRISF